MEVPADRERLVLARLEVDDERPVLAAERRDVAVRRAGERADGLDAAADQPAGHVEPRPPPSTSMTRSPTGFQAGRRRVLLEAPPVGDQAGVALGDRPGRRGDVEPVRQPLGGGVRRVGEVVAVERRQPGAQRAAAASSGGVGVADDPRGLGRRDRVVVEQVDQVDRGDAAPGRHDRADRRVGEHRRELGRPLLARAR